MLIEYANRALLTVLYHGVPGLDDACLAASRLASFIALLHIVSVVDEAKPIILDASKSYDPDFPEDALVFTWYCTSGKCSHLVSLLSINQFISQLTSRKIQYTIIIVQDNIYNKVI